ncbi:Leucine carboxyl methyltransferase [Actinacidiphila yanglinensis]|uniref:Leucine carboxyl methyltransferase n=1 Tax=Actinacidiphila yanglinensis TaxID=310779 RepID=A0A1H6ACD9_9ACTN|nr:class I SAM-dependent methyltransferase [Actinacidiphila yanglinensis]SEG46409.1 Leucine carboxyl methyltransferase [Actinacidiphila yanglinensis]
MQGGVGLTAYLVNESRARRPDLAQDGLAAAWIPEDGRPGVKALWQEFADAVYPHDDLVVSLRGRYIAETLAEALRADPDTVLVVCGAGFSSYPWLLPFPVAVEVDLPHMAEAKRLRAAELMEAGTAPERDVRHIGADLAVPAERAAVAEQVRGVAAGRPVAYVVEGVVFYLPPDDARALVTLGARFGTTAVTAVSYWPAAGSGSTVLADQRAWFRSRSVPEDASHHTHAELASLLGAPLDDLGPEDLQRRYLDRVEVPESALIPEYVAVAWHARAAGRTDRTPGGDGGAGGREATA